MTDPITRESSVADAETTPQLAPYGVTVTQVIRLPELIDFRADKRVRKKLFEGTQLWTVSRGRTFTPAHIPRYSKP